MENLTTIQLTDSQAELFIQFQKYYPNIKKLIDANVFDLKGGHAILNFNSSSEIQNIQKVLFYSYKKTFIQPIDLSRPIDTDLC